MRRFFAGAAVGLVLFLTGALLYWSAWFDPPESPLQSPEATAELRMPLLPPSREAEKPTYVLVMGVDERPQDAGRSDTMLLVRAGGGALRVLSLPRDTRVEIEGVGEAKLNAAYAYGGPELAKQTVSGLLGLPVDHYVKVNLEGFRALVDLIGGVPMHIDRPMRYEDPYDNLVIDLQPGDQVLDGRAAEQYVRFRNDEMGDDLSRIRRQQQFLRAAARRALQPANLPRLPSLLLTANRYVETDLSRMEQLRLAKEAFEAHQAGSLAVETLPGYGEYVGGISYFLHDQAELERMLQSWRSP